MSDKAETEIQSGSKNESASEVGREIENEEFEATWLQKSMFIFMLICGVADFAADILSMVVYWKEKDVIPNGLGIAIFATVSFALGLPFFVGQLIVTVRGFSSNISEWMATIDDTVNILKFCETTLESIPQLWISLYVLSLTERQPSDGSIILIISAAFSYTMIITSAIKFDQIFEDLVASNSTKSDIYTTLSSLSLYASKCIAVIARVFILVYMTVQVEWWTFLFVLVHFVSIGIISCIVAGDIDTSRWRHLKLSNITIIILEAIVSLFCWHVVGRDKMQYHLIFSALFTVENVAGLLLSWFLGLDAPFYLYENVLAVNLSLDAAALFCVILHVIFRKCAGSWETSVSASDVSRDASISNAAFDDSVDSVQ